MSMRPPASPVAEHALLRPVKSGNTFEETVERLAQAIKLGVVAHGERLPAERELAERLNVARVTLREAIKALQQAGFVESRRGRSGGTFVTYVAGRSRRSPRAVARTMGRDELLDALVFRSVVEPAAAELAASRVLTDADRASLTGHLAEVASASPSGRRLADSRLHLAIAELSGSSSLAAAVAQVQGRLDDLLASIPVLARNIAHSDAQHASVVKAILAGSPRRAHDAMLEHVEGTASLLRGFLA